MNRSRLKIHRQRYSMALQTVTMESGNTYIARTCMIQNIILSCGSNIQMQSVPHTIEHKG